MAKAKTNLETPTTNPSSSTEATAATTTTKAAPLIPEGATFADVQRLLHQTVAAADEAAYRLSLSRIDAQQPYPARLEAPGVYFDRIGEIAAHLKSMLDQI